MDTFHKTNVHVLRDIMSKTSKATKFVPTEKHQLKRTLFYGIKTDYKA
jgi:hypothetical protein